MNNNIESIIPTVNPDNSMKLVIELILSDALTEEVKLDYAHIALALKHLSLLDKSIAVSLNNSDLDVFREQMKFLTAYIPLPHIETFLNQVITQTYLSALINPEKKYKVYVLQLENSSVKIGITSSIDRRSKQIVSGSGMKIIEVFTSPALSEALARKIERLAHEHFKSKRLEGEYFDISFEEGCAKVSELLSVYNKKVIWHDVELLGTAEQSSEDTLVGLVTTDDNSFIFTSTPDPDKTGQAIVRGFALEEAEQNKYKTTYKLCEYTAEFKEDALYDCIDEYFKSLCRGTTYGL